MTKKKTRFKSKVKALLRDFFITLSCLGVCAASLWFFWRDLNLSSTRSDRDAIASITFKYKVAQRKFTDRVVWERLQQNSPLYNEDTIRTADMASATITFKGGEILDVHENSMVQIFQSADGGVRLTVEGGGIDVDTSSSKASAGLAVLMENGSTIQIEKGSRLAALTGAGGEASFQLKAGSGSIRDANNDDDGGLDLRAGDAVKIQASGEIKKVPFSVTSIPNDFVVLNLEEKAQPVHLEWAASDSAADKKIIVQTSKSRDFSSIDKTFTVQNVNSVDIPLEEGSLFWRVFEEAAIGGNLSVSEPVSGRIRMEKVAKPVLTAPVNDSSIKYRTLLPQVLFSWEGNDFADYYRLEISSAPDFFEPEILVDLPGTSYTTSKLKEGIYFWRVTPFYSLQNTGFARSTEPGRFTIAKAEALSAPVGVSPSDNANLFYVGDTLSTSFRWKSEAAPEGYQVLVSDSPDFDYLVWQGNSKNNYLQNEFSPAELPVGTYFWKVKRNPALSEGVEEAWSEAKSFKVSYYVPQKNRLLYPPEKFTIDMENIQNTSFVWKLSDELVQNVIKKGNKVLSQLQISSDSDFKNLVYENKTEATELNNITLAGGNYYWRVGIYGENSKIADYTEPFSFCVMKNLTAPVIAQPASSSSVMVSAVRPLKVRWQPVKGADFYSVRIFDKTKNLKIAENANVKGLEVSFRLENLSDKSDEFECLVQPAVEASEFSGLRRGEAASVNFTLRDAQPVQLISPVADAKIDGLAAFRNPLIFSWKEGIDQAEKSQFILQKLQPNGNFKTVFVIENPAKEVSMADLSEGTYRWIINASLADGSPINAVKYQSFTVTPIPELNKALLVEPAMDMVMDSNFLRKNRVLKFRWNAVDDATDYTFSLYKKTESGKLAHVITEKTGKNTYFRLKDLKILDVGQFEWQVTAYSLDKKGREEQHSKVSAGSFTIDIALPGRINVKDPGEIFVE